MTSCALVTGCTGQDGSYLSKSLIEKGYRVIGVSRHQKPNLINHKKLLISNGIEIIQDFLNSVNSFKRLLEKYSPDEIYHLSAQSSVGLSFQEPIKTYQSIVSSTNTILESCRELNYTGNIFFSGSSEIFGETKKGATSNSNVNPQSPYGFAKYQSMLMANMYRKIYNLSTVTGILFNHESPLRGKDFVTHKIINDAKNVQQIRIIKSLLEI